MVANDCRAGAAVGIDQAGLVHQFVFGHARYAAAIHGRPVHIANLAYPRNRCLGVAVVHVVDDQVDGTAR